MRKEGREKDMAEVSKSERVRANSETDMALNNTTFNYHFCDYDMSERGSVDSQASVVESETKSRTVITQIFDEKWYDKSSAAYFTSEATKNAQTVSWKQRHRPVFLMFEDLLTAILITFLFMLSAVLEIKEDIRVGNDEVDRVYGLLVSQSVRLVTFLFFFIRFGLFVTWYRINGKGNIIEHTMNLFMVRLATDIILWVFITFGTLHEMEATGVIDIDGGEDTTAAKDYE